MNNEINIKIPGQILNYVDTKEHLLDLFNYITNLQQENEDNLRCIKGLKDSRDWWKDRFFGQQEYDDSHRITAIEYKKRIVKAIEYIKEMLYPIGSCVNGSDLPYESIESLLNILQNGSEQE